MKLVVFSVYDPESNSVLQSQLNGRISVLARNGYNIKYLYYSSKPLELEQLFMRNVKTIFFQNRSLYGIDYLISILKRDDIDLLLAPTVIEVLVAKFVKSILGKNFRICFWVQGTFPEEAKLKGVNQLKYILFRLLQRIAFRAADQYEFVCQRAKDYFVSRYHINASSIVIPCLPSDMADSSLRSSLRAMYGYTEDDVVMIYSGGLSKWQNFDKILAIMKVVQKYRSNIKCLIFTKEINKAEHLIVEKGLLNYKVCELAQQDVINHLTAGDIGFLIRDNSIVNQIASPVKFAEYLGAGLPLVMTNTVGDYSQFLIDNHLGLVLDYEINNEDIATQLLSFIDRYNIDKSQIRSHCSNLIRNRLTWEKFSNSYIKFIAGEDMN